MFLRSSLFPFFICFVVGKPGELKFHPSFDPREERAALLRLNGLDDSNKSYSHSYLISVGKEGARSDKGEVFQDQDEVVRNVDSLMKTLSSSEDEFTSLSVAEPNQDLIQFPENKLEPRIPPPSPKPVSVVNHRRTSPADPVGFSAVRATAVSREGNSRIYFENTVTDTNYGWDARNSIFVTHFPGLYFFTFSVKADADNGDNFKYEVSLIKNGEEVVSVGGAVDPSLKNVGTSASNSVLLSLTKGDKVWLQLLRGGLVETTNSRTGYSSFSGYKVGCQGSEDEDDLMSVTMENTEEDEDIYGNGGFHDFHDKIDVMRPERPENNYQNNPNIYDEQNIFDAFNYRPEDVSRPPYDERRKPTRPDFNNNRNPLRPNSNHRRPYKPNLTKQRPYYGSDRPERPVEAGHRPFNDNGPSVDRLNRPNRYEDEYNDYFNDNRKSGLHRDKYNNRPNRFDNNKYENNEDKITRPWDRERDENINRHDLDYYDRKSVKDQNNKYDDSSFFMRSGNVGESHLSYG